jgi:hypothetical protein
VTYLEDSLEELMRLERHAQRMLREVQQQLALARAASIDEEWAEYHSCLTDEELRLEYALEEADRHLEYSVREWLQVEQLVYIRDFGEWPRFAKPGQTPDKRFQWLHGWPRKRPKGHDHPRGNKYPDFDPHARSRRRVRCQLRDGRVEDVFAPCSLGQYRRGSRPWSKERLAYMLDRYRSR